MRSRLRSLADSLRRAGTALRAWLNRPAVAVAFFVLVACGWATAVVNGGWSCSLNASHAGVSVAGGGVSFLAGVRWG
jgi:hypothetical protein